MKTIAVVILIGAALSVSGSARQHDQMKHRGAAAMGFDQDASVHHFLLKRDGGEIVVTSKTEPEAVRSHLREIAAAFARGEFDKPFATHGEVPPGVPVLIARQKQLSYRYDERTSGGAVVIATNDAAALAALHQFLRYQIVEHKTGDPLTVPQ